MFSFNLWVIKYVIFTVEDPQVDFKIRLSLGISL